MKNFRVTIFIALSITMVCCEKTATKSAALSPDHSPFEVHAPARSISIASNGKYRVDSSVVWNNTNKDRLVAELEKQELIEKRSVAEIPTFIRNFFDGLQADKKMDIADPGQEWRIGSPEVQLFDKRGLPLNSPLPSKQLVYFGIGKNMALFSWFVGDREKTQEMVILKFTGEKIIDLWFNRNTALVSSPQEIIRNIKETQARGGC